MKCHKCQFENIIKASYCHNCGEKFTDKEKELAYKNTIYGKIDSIKRTKDILTLSVITSHIAFKIASLLVVLGIGIYFLLSFGIHTKLLNSKDYKIYYNNDEKEYYLVVDDSYDSVDIALYRPNRVKKISVFHYNLDDSLIDNTVVNKDEVITLNTYQDDYYIIESNYGKKKIDSIKIYVYHNVDLK